MNLISSVDSTRMNDRRIDSDSGAVMLHGRAKNTGIFRQISLW